MILKLVILVVVLFGGILLLAEWSRVCGWYFLVFQLKGMLRRYDWEYQVTPREFTPYELHAISDGGSASQERQRISGTYRGHEFSAISFEVPAGGPQPSLKVGRESILEVHASGIPGGREVSISRFGAAVTINPPFPLSVEFEQWLRKNHGPCLQFSMKPNGSLIAALGDHLTGRRLLRTLDFLVGVAENWSTAEASRTTSRVERARRAGRRRKKR